MPGNGGGGTAAHYGDGGAPAQHCRPRSQAWALPLLPTQAECTPSNPPPARTLGEPTQSQQRPNLKLRETRANRGPHLTPRKQGPGQAPTQGPRGRCQLLWQSHRESTLLQADSDPHSALSLLPVVLELGPQWSRNTGKGGLPACNQ